MTTVLGLDIGGSRSRLLVLGEDRRVLFEAEDGPGNPAAVGEAGAAAVLERLLAKVGAELREGLGVCCCGAAGADSEPARENLRRLLERLLPGVRIEVVPDARLVLAAADLDRGVALVCGTGSIAYGVAGAQVVRAGGWGHRLGDEGSGYWVVREAVRGILRASDQGLPVDPLQRELMERAGTGDPGELTRRFHQDHDPRWWAAMSDLALQSESILQRAAEELAALVGTVRGRLGVDLPVVLAGGVLMNTPSLEAEVRRRLGGEVTRLAAEPVLGAALLARASTAFGAR